MDNRGTKLMVIGAAGVSFSALGIAVALNRMNKKNIERQSSEALLCCADELPVVNDLPQLSPEYLTLSATSKKK
jgi:hypothetical protein